MTDLTKQSHAFLQRRGIHTEWQSDYLNPDMDAFWDAAFADILKRINPGPNDTILDAGCGYCYHTVRLARSGAKITAVDFSESAIEAARETLAASGLQDHVSLRQADLTSLPFPDASFDFVVSNGVLMHIPELEKALSELARVLKPGGTMILNENNMDALDVKVRERIIVGIKALIGRSRDKINLTPRGIEVWKQSDDGGLMVRKTNMKFLSDFLLSKGLTEIARTPSQFTEAYTNMPTRSLKRLIYGFNTLCLKWNIMPSQALGNIIYFHRQAHL